MGALTLVVGGQKAGKSRTALRIAEAHGRGVVLVTPAEGRDPELAERIARHRADRPAGQPVLETFDLVQALLHPEHAERALVVDAIDTWLLHHMEAEGLLDVPEDAGPLPLGEDGRAAAERVLAEVDLVVTATARRPGPVVVVAGTVGMGMHGPSTVARRYEDLHGLTTQRLGAASQRALLVVAGRTLELQPLHPLDPRHPGTGATHA